MLLGTAAFASLGLLVAGALRAEATLAAANLVYLLLLAGGAVVLPASAYGGFGARRRSGCPPAPSARRCATRFLDGDGRLARPGGAARLGRRSAPSLTARTFRGSEHADWRRAGCARWPGPRLVANIGIVVTGGAVRLTGSGLGCPTWPRCTDSRSRPHGELGLH